MSEPVTLSRRGMILILSSPSGAGKTTLTRMLLQDKALDLTLSISVTTRARRSSEVDGIHYHFIDRRAFDRLKAHVAAARGLLQQGGPVGRRLDFLAQEFGREANTLCAKSNDVSLTRQGLELRAQIEQLREQVQNIE